MHEAIVPDILPHQMEKTPLGQLQLWIRWPNLGLLLCLLAG